MRRLWLVLAGCALAASQSAAIGAGQFQFVSGSIRVLSQAGLERVAAKGMRVAEHETIVTGRDSIAQLKMRDGATLVIQPESRATVEVFRYSGKEDGTEQFVLRIHRGGFRGITGAIGRTHKENFRIETPIAQMGVRGTDQESYYFPPPTPGEPMGPPSGAYNKVNVGAMYLRTAGGEVDIRPNQVGYAESAQAAPNLMPSVPEFFHRAAGVRRADAQRPEELPAGNSTLGQPVVVQPIRVSSDTNQGATTTNLSNPQTLPAPGPGAPAPGPGSPAPGPGAPAPAPGAPAPGPGAPAPGPGAPAPGPGAPAPGAGAAASAVAYVEPVGGADFGRSGINLAVSPNGSVLVDTGSDAALGVNWGSWQGPVTVSGNPTSGWAHFASAASTTSAAQLAALPSSLVTATYNYAGGPAPTNQIGTQGTVNALAATVNFSTQMITNYTLNATVDGKTWAAAGNGSFVQLAGSSGINLNGSCNACSGGGGPAGANGQAHGVFVGNTAQGMLTAFGLKSSQHAVSGAALLKR